MNKRNINFSSVAYLPAIFAGLTDSVSNPGILTVLFLFCFFLLFLSGRNCGIFFPGLFFILGVLIFAILINIGVFDFLYNTRGVEIFWDVGFFLIALFCIYLGFHCIRDWWFYKIDKNDERVKVKTLFLANNVYLKNKDQSVKRSSVLVKGLGYSSVALVLGSISACLQAAWPPSPYMNRIVQYYLSSGMSLQSVLAFIAYGIAYVFPLIVLWIIIQFLLRSGKIIDYFDKYLSIVQITTAAIFMACGIVLLVYYT